MKLALGPVFMCATEAIKTIDYTFTYLCWVELYHHPPFIISACGNFSCLPQTVLINLSVIYRRCRTTPCPKKAPGLLATTGSPCQDIKLIAIWGSTNPQSIQMKKSYEFYMEMKNVREGGIQIDIIRSFMTT